MYKIWRMLLGVVLACGLVAGASVADAHSMTQDEVTLILDKGDNLQGQIKIGDTLGVVADLLGNDCKKTDFQGEGIRMVAFTYSNGDKFYGRTSAKDTRPAEELPLAGYRLQSNVLHTPSGITVGTPFDKVVEQFGLGRKSKSHSTAKEEISIYYYDVYHGVRELCFDVNAEGLVNKIVYRQEV